MAVSRVPDTPDHRATPLMVRSKDAQPPMGTRGVVRASMVGDAGERISGKG